MRVLSLEQIADKHNRAISSFAVEEGARHAEEVKYAAGQIINLKFLYRPMGGYMKKFEIMSAYIVGKVELRIDAEWVRGEDEDSTTMPDDDYWYRKDGNVYYKL